MKNTFNIESTYLGGAWFKGIINEGEYEFQAKVYDTGSIYGIESGRISKLCIMHNSKNCIANYDRGWDIRPNGSTENSIVETVVEYCEELPIID